MPEKKNIKEKMALCGSYFLSGAAIASTALAVAAPFVLPPEAAKEAAAGLLLAASTFSAAAQKTGNKYKSAKTATFQNTATKLALCGFAVLTGTSEITEDMQRMEDINRPKPAVIAVERQLDKNDELRPYWQSVIDNKTFSIAEFEAMAAKISAKDLDGAKDKEKIAAAALLCPKHDRG